MTRNPILDFTVTAEDLSYIGEDLQRPECILAKPDGSLWAADARGGVVHIKPDGSQKIITQTFGNLKDQFEEAVDEATRFTEGTLPNGMAFGKGGQIYISNFGTDVLEVMAPDGETKTIYDSIDGKAIGKVNFVLRDSKDRLWLTVSTRIKNWMQAMSPNVADGYVALADENGLRVVADGFGFTNEVRLDANEDYIYIVETTGQRISRMKVADDGALSGREVYGPSKLGKAGANGFPDGITFDAYGNLWGTLIMSDQIFAITPEGEYHVILDDLNQAPAEALETAFRNDEATPELMLAASGTIAPWMASVTFGGPDLKTAYIGSLRGTRIPYFTSPIAGLAMAHWND
ncbi:MAG: SMP-30/gluconolactonase/LRE family protein [Rhodospirillaceae bacterium]|jgi:gluconolactonase|nr:SMP-30/gluconolactonase/LRE family protein [Rhodospirillaceae bacterium]MBT4588384.1 SMP-30/gluconolactonase/LRE family protein [Rhodospirillaceae bacterium]MBT4938013.1 SMP-30/gluconolactonase/LRE family protein [Rhodospirillaceae bacterium]MBT5938892.1 SMP-30/gluconolactonase/LRE family protein [Rhodospirillaceae bacterium]MBT7267468.1 SMP-30/gluconolactonase/LRE family protein [Rhodospirillaceae bacterium]